MCTFWPPEDQGPKTAQKHPKTGGQGVVSGVLWCARTLAGSRDAHLGTRFGRSIGLGEAVMLDKIMPLLWGYAIGETTTIMRPCEGTS